MGAKIKNKLSEFSERFQILNPLSKSVSILSIFCNYMIIIIIKNYILQMIDLMFDQQLGFSL